MVEDVIFAKSKVDRTNLWALRERTLEPTDHEGTWLRADVSLPQKLLAKYFEVLERRLTELAPEQYKNAMGHAEDGNLLVAVCPHSRDITENNEIFSEIV